MVIVNSRTYNEQHIRYNVSGTTYYVPRALNYIIQNPKFNTTNVLSLSKGPTPITTKALA
ncbi:MAG: hypothetical protein HQ565_07755 [Bacteroidetes bacterium]|nr:hypothetical protein [Bacteroidota bacterium]